MNAEVPATPRIMPRCHIAGFEASSFFAFRFSNAYEEGDELVADVCRTDRMGAMDAVATIRLRNHIPFGFHGHFTHQVFL